MADGLGTGKRLVGDMPVSPFHVMFQSLLHFIGREKVLIHIGWHVGESNLSFLTPHSPAFKKKKIGSCLNSKTFVDVL
jgi:hypothetical protein